MATLGLTFVSSNKHKATKQQQRDRAKRRAARVEQAELAKQAERKRTGQVLAIVLAVVVLVAGVVFLSKALGSGGDSEQPADAATTAAADLPANCTPPPATPSSALELELPNLGAAAGKTFEAVVTTNCGDITLELDGEQAPQAVASFLELAEQGFYTDSPCHRLLASGNVVLQCGDPTGTGTGGPGYGYGVEYVPEDGAYPRGTLAMARTGDLEQGTGSQFFIVATDSVWPPEGGGYTIFGNVTSGMEIIDQVVEAGVAGGGSDGSPALPLSILEVAVTEK